MLANVALTALDDDCHKNFGTIQYRTKKSGGNYLKNPIIRYADDFVIVCKSEPEARDIKVDKLDYEDISLILWADSVGEQRYLDEIWTKLENQSKFFKEQCNGLSYRTMEMAWLLTALCHYYPFAKNQDVIQELSTRVKAAILVFSFSRFLVFIRLEEITRQK